MTDREYVEFIRRERTDGPWVTFKCEPILERPNTGYVVTGISDDRAGDPYGIRRQLDEMTARNLMMLPIDRYDPVAALDPQPIDIRDAGPVYHDPDRPF